MLRTQLADTPPRADIDAYELARMAAELEAEIEADGHRERLARRREREVSRHEWKGTRLPPQPAGVAEAVERVANDVAAAVVQSAKFEGVAEPEALVVPRRARKPKRPKGGFKRGKEPRVQRLVISGDPMHSVARQRRRRRHRRHSSRC